MYYFVVFFLIIGVIDKIIFNNKYGYGSRVEHGIQTVGQLIFAMAGLMCGAPLIGKVFNIVFSPLCNLIHVDKGMISGMFLPTDMGGFPVTAQLTSDKDIQLLSGVLLSGTLGLIFLFAIPVSLSMCKKENHPYVCKGMSYAIIASIFCPIIGGLVAGINLLKIIWNLIPVLVIVVLLTYGLKKHSDGTVKLLLILSKIIESIGLIFLVISIIKHLLNITILPGLDDLSEQLLIIADIGIVLMGAYPMLYFVEKVLNKPIQKVAIKLNLDNKAVTGMLASLANPIPAFELINELSPKSIVVMISFVSLANCCFGDYIGYLSSVSPENIPYMIIGKLSAGFIALFIALKKEKLCK